MEFSFFRFPSLPLPNGREFHIWAAEKRKARPPRCFPLKVGLWNFIIIVRRRRQRPCRDTDVDKSNQVVRASAKDRRWSVLTAYTNDITDQPGHTVDTWVLAHHSRSSTFREKAITVMKTRTMISKAASVLTTRYQWRWYRYRWQRGAW